MRKHTVSAVLGAILLTACGDQSQQTLTGPQAVTPSAAVAATLFASCTPPTTAQVNAVFPAGSLRNSANDKISQIFNQCSKGKVLDARNKAFFFIGWMYKKLQAGALGSPIPDDVLALANAVLGGLGLPGLPSADFFVASSRTSALGVYDPAVNGTGGVALLVINKDKSSATEIPAGGFGNLVTLITLFRLPDSENPFPEGVSQFPPFYDINAENANSNQASGHYLAGNKGIVGLCVDAAVLAEIEQSEGDVQLGHNRIVDGGKGGFFFVFEVLEAASAEEYARLGLSCTVQANPGFTSSAMLKRAGPLGDLALGAWEAAKFTATSVFLPQPAEATTKVTSGVGGRTSSYSPFGVVDANTTFDD